MLDPLLQDLREGNLVRVKPTSYQGGGQKRVDRSQLLTEHTFEETDKDEIVEREQQLDPEAVGQQQQSSSSLQDSSLQEEDEKDPDKQLVRKKSKQQRNILQAIAQAKDKIYTVTQSVTTNPFQSMIFQAAQSEDDCSQLHGENLVKRSQTTSRGLLEKRVGQM